MLYPYSGDDTILETPERAPKVPGQNSIIFYKKFLETKCLDTNWIQQNSNKRDFCSKTFFILNSK